MATKDGVIEGRRNDGNVDTFCTYFAHTYLNVFQLPRPILFIVLLPAHARKKIIGLRFRDEKSGCPPQIMPRCAYPGAFPFMVSIRCVTNPLYLSFIRKRRMNKFDGM